MDRAQILSRLETLVRQGALSMTSMQCGQCVDYVIMLHKWNQAYNLTAARDVQTILTHHIMDSLMIAAFVDGTSVLDVGTGAGLPGIPLSIFYPEKRFCLLDSNGKKIRFLKQVVYELGLQNVILKQTRVESLGADLQFDVIMARAVADLASIIASTRYLLAARGRYVLQKGAYPERELQEIVLPARVEVIQVPGLEAQRHLVIINNEG